MRFQTDAYKEKRDAYEKLKNKLASRVTQHQTALSSADELYQKSKGSGFYSNNLDLPNKDADTTFRTLETELSTLFTTQKNDAASLQAASNKAIENYNEYSDLYEAEKKNEADYKKEQEEKKRKEAEEKAKKK